MKRQPNPYFQFKAFTVHHDRCAMKVTTEACLFGAWFAGKNTIAANVLDIGAGTGLLTLMLAQKRNAAYTAIEIDENAFSQMCENFENSGWAQHIFPINGDLLSYQFQQPFDFVIVNPPFYEKALTSPDNKRNIAMHESALTLEALVRSLGNLVSEKGSFGILIPHFRADELIGLAKEERFHLLEHLKVKQTPTHPFFRSILHFSRLEAPSTELAISIRNSNGDYDVAFKELLRDYYLHL